MSEYTNNDHNSDYIEYYMLNAWWGNDWITIAFCSMCGVLSDPEGGNVYKLNKEYFDIYFCNECFHELKKRNVIKDWEKIELYWQSLQSCPELR